MTSLRPEYKVVKTITDEGETVFAILDSIGDEQGTWDTRDEAKEMASDLADDEEKDALVDAIDIDSLDLVTLRKIHAMLSNQGAKS